MKILYLGRKLDVVDGGSIVTNRNLIYLKKISQGNLLEFTLRDKSILGKLLNIIIGNPWGYKKSLINEIKNELVKSKYSYIFIDHSLLGGYAKILYNFNVPIITFFHNVEYFYYKEKVKVDGFSNFLMIWAAINNEKSALKYSSRIICLTKRDSKLLKSIYGRGANLILPTTLKDMYSNSGSIESVEGKYHLFVGSAFFANLDGICWYIDRVLNQINLVLIVIGNGMEVLKKKYHNHPRLIVKGFVEQLEPYYKNADFVVNPISTGSGMKTKTVEALMYGKTIIGTKEAFTGIENVEDKNIGFLCESVDQFVATINNFNGKKHNVSSRKYFLENFDLERELKNFETFLK